MNRPESQARPLALTMGEPAGIAPEITAKAWQRRRDLELPPFLYVGSAEIMTAAGADVHIVSPGTRADEIADIFGRALPAVDMPLAEAVEPGRPSAANASAVIGAVERAVELAQGGRVAGVVTNPIQKGSLYEAGFEFAGHTDFLSHLAGQPADGAVMLLVAGDLRTALVTVHIPLADVPSALTKEAIRHVAIAADKDLRHRFGISRPRLRVAALNPHAGESGSLGHEEIEVIAPAIAALKAEGIDASGPYPADTLFHPAARKSADAVICMYHDQALIPVKTIDFDHGVNVTLGLPFIRTSPDHGTALDIAGQGRASEASLVEALRLAAAMANRESARGMAHA